MLSLYSCCLYVLAYGSHWWGGQGRPTLCNPQIQLFISHKLGHSYG